MAPPYADIGAQLLSYFNKLPVGVLTTIASPVGGTNNGGYAIPVDVARSETLEIVQNE